MPSEPPGSLGSLRRRNRLRILDVLRRGPASRVALVEQTGLSRTTVSKLVAELKEEGLVVEQGVEGGAHTVGRPPAALGLNPAAGAAVGIDFGHSFLRVAVADLSGSVLAEIRRELDVDNNAEAAIEMAAVLTDDLLRSIGLEVGQALGIGAAVSAPILRETGELGSAGILPGWVGRSPGRELEQRLGRRVLVGNDANLGALAEVRHGAGRGARNVLYVMLAAGIGAGLILDGQLFTGHSGLTGELGHVVVDPGGALCRCGNRGCLETVAAAPALLRELAPLHGPDVTLEAAIAMARAGDEACVRLFADAGRAVGRAVGAVANLVNPEVVIVGGDMSVVGEPLVDGVREGVARSTLPAVRADARIVPASLGDRAEVLGAIGLVLAQAQAGEIAAVAGALGDVA